MGGDGDIIHFVTRLAASGGVFFCVAELFVYLDKMFSICVSAKQTRLSC